MKIEILLGIVLCCFAAVSSQRLQYRGIAPDGSGHIYAIDGTEYLVSQDNHELIRRNPEAAERKMLADLRNAPTTNGRNPSAQPQLNAAQNKPPTNEEIFNSQNFNSFKPNKRPNAQQNNKQDQPSQTNQNPQFSFPPNIPDQTPSFGNLNIKPNINQSFRPSQNAGNLPPQNTGYSNQIPRDREANRDESEGYGAVTDFALNLFKSSNTEENFVISPLSPQILLSYLSWVADGNTRKELWKTCGYGHPFAMQELVSSLLSEGSKREIQLATAFFVSPEMRLNQNFIDRSVNSADVVAVDFKQPQAAGRTIKRWAETKTKGALKLNEISYAPSTKIALTSAIYFKGKFVYTFQPARPGTFYTPRGPVRTDMMYMKKKFRAGNMGNYARWAAIPYESNDALVIILPNENVDINIAMQSITERDLNDVLYGLESENTKANVNLTMPKFRLESTTNLIDPLKRMGLTKLFTPNSELPYLSDYPDVQVSNAQQQASLDVSEDGTVLIAFTNLNVVALSFQLPVPDVEFNVNRPFIAMIAETKRVFPYVFAKVTDPTK